VLVGRWWALALPVFAVVLAIPAGNPDANKGEPWPISLSLVLWCPVALFLVGIGIVSAWRFRGRRPGWTPTGWMDMDLWSVRRS
jgi:type VI protein secretion system component VasK